MGRILSRDIHFGSEVYADGPLSSKSFSRPIVLLGHDRLPEGTKHRYIKQKYSADVQQIRSPDFNFPLTHLKKTSAITETNTPSDAAHVGSLKVEFKPFGVDSYSRNPFCNVCLFPC